MTASYFALFNSPSICAAVTCCPYSSLSSFTSIPYALPTLAQRSANFPLLTLSTRLPGAIAETIPASAAAVPDPVIVQTVCRV